MYVYCVSYIGYWLLYLKVNNNCEAETELTEVNQSESFREISIGYN